MSSFRTIIANAFWLGSDRILRLAVNFFVVVLVARHLGPDGFGLLNYGLALLMLFTPLASFGLPELTVRELSRSGADPARIMATTLGVRLILSLLTLAIIALVAVLGRGGNATAMIVIILLGASVIPQSFDVFESRFQSMNSVRVIYSARMITTVIFGALRLLAVALSAHVAWFALLSTLEIAAFACFTVFEARRRGFAAELSAFDRRAAWALIRTASPLMIRQVAILIYLRIDQVLIQHLLGDAALGVYSASTRISELWYFVPGAIVAGAAPTLTRRHEEGDDVYAKELTRLMRLMVYLSIPLAAGISLLAPFIIPILFGAKYAAAIPVLQIQAWSGVFVALGVASNPWFINTGHLRYGVYQAVAGAVMSLILNFAMIPRLGLTGAAISIVVSQIVSSILVNAIFPATRGLFRMQLRSLLPR
jgi:PST family polysaccharide transporter